MKRISGLAVVFLALLPQVAEAHAHLVQATPANDSVLTQAPPRFMLLFNEPARLAPGSYTWSYRLVSDDSHIMSGSIKFRIREP